MSRKGFIYRPSAFSALPPKQVEGFVYRPSGFSKLNPKKEEKMVEGKTYKGSDVSTAERLKEAQEDYSQGYENGKKDTIENSRRVQAYNHLAKAEEFLTVMFLDRPHTVFKPEATTALYHARKAREELREKK